jgi:cytochrome c
MEAMTRKIARITNSGVYLVCVLLLLGLGACTDSGQAEKELDAAESTAEKANGTFSRDQLAAADWAKGRLAFQQRCSACHTLAEGGANLVGPNLYGLFAGKAGSHEEFSYSEVFAGTDFSWTPDSLAQFLTDPEAFLPGTRMLIPEGVPAGDQLAIVSFIMLESGGADWERPEIEEPESTLSEDTTIAEKFPSFWNHMMNNTTHYRFVTDEGELVFDAYFEKNGLVSTNHKTIKGFWRVDERDFFCYALKGIPLAPKQFVECFPVAAMAIPRFAEELWKSNPAEGVTLHGGIVAGRPEP